ncbi:TfoX-like protein [Brevibacterium sanguinis]|uniref:TfoX-like protein n=2 Tax=Brevibacterium TaxID=1696 RepID=A0A366IIJ9_9MICO|nr:MULTISPECIES: TfoX/Sxy family protein [Brevibacterium]RBP63636.1 TfoX-like protein [Brevibacterium sanguinis]RBP70295.1 TfoX-like protein [Brevibacterium celere]
MTPEQNVLIERLRVMLVDEPVVREVSMFGGRSVMVNEKMIVSALKDGGLLVRVDGDRHDKLLTRRGAIQAEMGPGRDMGPGWIEVAADAISDDEQLATWVEIAMDYNRLVTGVHR